MLDNNETVADFFVREISLKKETGPRYVFRETKAKLKQKRI